MYRCCARSQNVQERRPVGEKSRKRGATTTPFPYSVTCGGKVIGKGYLFFDFSLIRHVQRKRCRLDAPFPRLFLDGELGNARRVGYQIGAGEVRVGHTLHVKTGERKPGPETGSCSGPTALLRLGSSLCGPHGARTTQLVHISTPCRLPSPVLLFTTTHHTHQHLGGGAGNDVETNAAHPVWLRLGRGSGCMLQ